MNRRRFLSHAATVGGVAACGPAYAFGHEKTEGTTYVPNTFRWVGGQLTPVLDDAPRIADYIVFARFDKGRMVGRGDVFVRAPAPKGHNHPTILSPLGRHSDLHSAYRSVCRHTYRLHAAIRRNDPVQSYVENGIIHTWPLGL